MKKCIGSWFSRIMCFVGMFLLFLVGSENVKAVNYTYPPADATVKTEEKEGVVVNEIDYDYLTVFTTKDDLGVNIKDDSTSLFDTTFYSGQRVMLSVKHVPKSGLFDIVKNSDYTVVYQYSFERNDFKAELIRWTDEDSAYVFEGEKALYKVQYYFKDVLQYTNYIFVDPTLDYAKVEGDNKYDNTSVFGQFSINLELEDTYDLRNNQYYYAFGSDSEDLSYTSLSVFTTAEKNASTAVRKLSRSLSLDVSDYYDENDQSDKTLFVKIKRTVNGDTKEFVINTSKAYKLVNGVEASVLLVDKDGNVLPENQYYYKQGDVINFSILFNTPVKWENLKYNIRTTTYVNLAENSISVPSKDTTSVNVSYTVNMNDITLTPSLKFSLLTASSAKPMVIVNGDTVELNVNTNDLAEIKIDSVGPVLTLDNPYELGSITKNKFNVLVTGTDNSSGIKSVVYYAAKCKTLQNNECKDLFDDTNELISEANFVGSDKYELVIDDRFGKYDREGVTLFVKSTDKAGNVTKTVFHQYLIDNVIIADEDKVDELFYDDLSSEMKNYFVKVSDSYDVSEVELTIGDNVSSAFEVEDDGLDYHTLYLILQIKYDFKADVKVKLIDKYGNEEVYNKLINYTTLVDGEEFTVDQKDFVVSTENKESIGTVGKNVMNSSDNNKYVFNEAVFNKIESVLKLNSDTYEQGTLKKELIMIAGGKVIPLLDNVGDELVFPSLSELVEKAREIDEYKACALKGNECSFDTYIRYTYKIIGVVQERLVKVTFEDETHKYSIENFVLDKKVNVNGVYTGYSYELYDWLNVKIDSKNVVESVKIMYTDLKGDTKEVDKIDTAKVGVYTVTRSATYNNVSTYPLVYTVSVVDLEAPKLRLVGNDKITIKQGDKYVDDGLFTATDNYDTKVTIKCSWNKEFDTNKAGTYIANYWAEDGSGNKSETISITVVVEAKDNLSLYLKIGGIILAVVLIIGLAIFIEVKRSRNRG